MKHIRVCAVLMALILLSTFVCTSCGESDENGPDTVAGTIEEPATDDPYKTLDLPTKMDFGNYRFSVLTVEADGLYTEFDVEGYNSDPVNDAIYSRNRVLEDRFHVVFETAQDGYDATMSAMQKQVQSGVTGDAAYDLIMQICRNAYSLTLNGMLCDYNRLEYVDIDKEYYFDKVNKQFSIAGKTFFAYGADSLNVLTQANCLLFNQRIVKERSLPDLYEMVNNLTWTYAEMFKVVTDAAEDKNGDGKMTFGKDDVMGLVGRNDYTIPNSWMPAGEKLISKDEDDMPFYSALGNERMESAMQDMLTFMANPINNVIGNTTPILEFIKEEAFMLGGGVMHLQDCKEMESDYGVVPYPMYDQVQGQYYTRLIDGWINCVPANCEDPARTSAIMQALAYYSYGTVYDAYYELGLQAKYIRDPQSVDMLKLILSTMTVDLGDTVWYSSMRSAMTGSLSGTKGAGQVTSVLKRMEKVSQNQIRNVTRFLEKNGD